jgi:hypothetical protein
VTQGDPPGRPVLRHERGARAARGRGRQSDALAQELGVSLRAAWLVDAGRRDADRIELARIKGAIPRASSPAQSAFGTSSTLAVRHPMPGPQFNDEPQGLFEQPRIAEREDIDLRSSLFNRLTAACLRRCQSSESSRALATLRRRARPLAAERKTPRMFRFPRGP